MIKNNLSWEQTRYLATILYNTNATKRSQMLKPEDLFKLPQDKIYKSGPKSTKEEYLKFQEKVDQAKTKIKNPLF